MDIKKIEELVQVIEKSSMLDFTIKEGDTKISMSRRGEVGQAGAPVAVSLSTQSTAVQAQDDEECYITSPIVGTFYSSPTPEDAAFVNVGDTVKQGQTVCILEAMKMMNAIESDFDCEIESVLVSNEQKVEFGQPLFRVKRV